jgi:AcrR family transcriptional regulator
MTMGRVNEKYREEAKERIITAAIEVAVERGWESMTLEAIAQKVGVTIPALYSYFKNRDALEDEVVLKVREDYQAEIEKTLGSSGNIRQIMEDYACLIFVHHTRYANLITHLPPRLIQDPKQRDKILSFYITTLQIIHDCLARAQSRGEIPKNVDLDGATRMINAITFGLQISVLFLGTTDIEAEKKNWLVAVERLLLLG